MLKIGILAETKIPQDNRVALTPETIFNLKQKYPQVSFFIEKTDEGFVLEGHKIPFYDEAVKLVQQEHLNLPFFDIIGWDVAISEDGQPIIIEFNVLPELTQSATGPAFGEHTERVIREIINKNKGNFNK